MNTSGGSPQKRKKKEKKSFHDLNSLCDPIGCGTVF